MSDNLGKARVKVELLDKLPHITKAVKRYQFDVNALIWDTLQKPNPFYPFLAEYVTDGSESFSAIFPARRHAYVNNYIVYGSGEWLGDPKVPAILWRPISNWDGIIYDIVSDLEKYTLYHPGDYHNAPPKYIGPEWADAVIPGIPKPNDEKSLQLFISILQKTPAQAKKDGEAPPVTTKATTTLAPLPEPELHVINQKKVRDGMWWEVESSSFLSENMPFWVTVRRSWSPASSDTETAIVLQMGIGSTTDAYDLYLSNQKKPQVIEYVNGRKEGVNGGEGGSIIKTASFEEEGSILFENEDYIQIGVMAVAGRLVFYVNDNILIYSRQHGNANQSKTDKVESERNKQKEEEGKLKEAKIAAGPIRVFGTNIQVTIDACPMTFTPISALALDSIPVVPPETDPDGKQDSKKTAMEYMGVNEKVEAVKGRTVAEIPKEDTTKLFGVDCKDFVDSNGTCHPEGFGFHQNGSVFFVRSLEVGVTVYGKEDFYMLIMDTGDIVGGVDFAWTIANAGAPYFFKLKGAIRIDPQSTDVKAVDISNDVLELSEDVQAEEYYAIRKSASVTLYNKGGTYDYLKTEQRGVRLCWGWDTEEEEVSLTQTFTGIIVSTSFSETPGEEKITLTCKDYMFILDQTPIFNSPIYDGMVMYYAAKDLVNRAGITEVIDDWTSEAGSQKEEYFLPSGFTFSQPKVHFNQEQVLFECLKYMLERPEAFAYFDADGVMHIKKIPGGIFSDTTKESISATLYRDPEIATYSQLILDEKSVAYDYTSTVNKIVMVSVDADTRGTLLHTETAKEAEDNLIFRKTMLFKQPALGNMDVVRSYAKDLAKRVFYPIRKTAFKTAGDVSILDPFSFLTVDGEEYRLISLSRKYSAGANDFTNEYNTEWLGGA